MTLSKAQRVGYWTLMAIFCIGIVISAMLYLTRAPSAVNEFARLGYPTYFMLLLGVGKLLGVVALVLSRSAVIKEWCYALFTINLIAAAASHLFMDDPVNQVILPLLFLTVLAACYKLEHPKHHLK